MVGLINLVSILGFLSCMNVAYSNKASGCMEPLGVEYINKIPNKQITSSSSKAAGRGGEQGRLNNKRKAWCVDPADDKQWMQIDFLEAKTITAVKRQGHPHLTELYVKEFAILYSYDGKRWYNYTLNSEKKTHIFSDGKHVMEGKTTDFPDPITARFIRINPRSWSHLSTQFCLRVEFYGCVPKKDCFTSVGMEDGRIKDSQIHASSVYANFAPHNGRLNKKADSLVNGAWCVDRYDRDQNQYLQIDLLRKRNVSAVASQGYTYSNFVTKYRLNYSMDGKTWFPCTNKHGKIVFTGNSDNNTIEKSQLNPVVTAKYIRFNPVAWTEFGAICMRVEIYECLPIRGSIPGVIQQLPRFSDVDKGGHINLTCSMKGQFGIIIRWYQRDALIVQSLTTNIINTSTSKSKIAKSTLSLSNVPMSDNGITFECRGSYPGVKSFYASTKTVLRVGADQPPLSMYSKTSVSLTLSVPYRKKNITEKYWLQFREKNVTDKNWKEKSISPNEQEIYTLSNLKPWTFYEVKVTPLHRQNVKGRTSVTELFRTAEAVPSAPRFIAILQLNEYNATIKWQPPKYVRGIIKHYLININKTQYYRPIVVNVAHGTVYTIVHLLPSTLYEFQVSVVNGAGEGIRSKVHYFTTADENPITTAKPLVKKVNLEELSQINVTERNVESVAENVKNLTSNVESLEPKDISLTAEILEKIVKTKSKDPQVGDELLETISHILDVEPDVLEESNKENRTSPKFVKILEEYMENGGDFSRNSSNVVVRVERILHDRKGKVTKTFGNNTIEIPEEALVDAENETMYFVLFKNGNLFKPKHLIREQCLESGFTENVYEVTTPVMSSSISGKTVANLSDKVIIRFVVDDAHAIAETSSCVFWDFDEAGGAGDWSDRGCKRTRIYNNTIECSCDHMTNFAALLDIYAETSKACGVHGDALTMISYFGCVLSICGLWLTIFTYLFFRRLRKELAAKILIQLCVALLCVLLVFVIGIERSRVGPIGCYIVAVLLHYFVLAAFMWMLIEARFMYFAFVKVWSHHGDYELLKCSFIAWGFPAVIVGVTMAVDLDNYGGTHYCRIERMAFYAAFFGPILSIVFINLVIFGIILYKLNNRPDSSLDRDRNATAQRMKQAVGIMILVGITWAFGALAISKARLVFHYLFAIFNSIQGFSIFLFYCLSQKNVRESWKALLTCQLNNLHKEKSMQTNTYDRRRCSTASTTHNTTLSLARKTTSTSSGNVAHSMDTLTREFTSFNCQSETLPRTNRPGQNTSDNFIPDNFNDSGSNRVSWKPDVRIARTNSSETLCSDDTSGHYDLVASNSNLGSSISLDSGNYNLSQSSDHMGFYSFGNSKDSLQTTTHNFLDNPCRVGESYSAPGTPMEMKRLKPCPISRKKQATLPTSAHKSTSQVEGKPTSDQLNVPGDFGKLIVNPSRGSVRGVMRVVETSVDTYDEDTPNLVTPQEVRLTSEKQGDEIDPNQCITSPAYFAENSRASRGSDPKESTSEPPAGDICL